ncbi:bifunctional transcriptional activator/DNA repair enzyme AdaA [Alicyclobacillus fastidiosus]|uniref:Bifunctional transcriptional activator/DNA repair enzyme AdaA n=1 Tax=Alicyclobacillus fastidiosus TaxID=392011 RepID=A0ABY6ZFD2_9BACL|nr:bifunctional transcriptional activator/DNA repair enzyme AdaA [Alicyclobacillus fastidiosus]WAH41212.1 bifunctional transcriptional activator/DNA repair enzyme AdaA [Alicyclobacillus fastidiosus]GMA62794.1 AraC family transcriptional regulator [Alicyclobacillus fastidiosus]
MQEEQWNAIASCDSAYDGQFFYAVKTTGIFCRPSCKSRIPKRDNVVVFLTIDAAMDADFRPCKRCKPDQFQWPAEELARKTMDYIDAHHSEPLTLGIMANGLHINQYHLHHIFKRVVGVTPREYLLQKRIAQAKRLLDEREFSVTDIAASVGFVNAAHFSTVFRKQIGLSPSEYRNRPKTTDSKLSELDGGAKWLC